MRIRIGKYRYLIWRGWLPKIEGRVNLAEWRRKSNFVDAACKAAELEDDENKIQRR